MNQRVLIAVGVGFAVGVLLGFVYAQQVQSRLGAAVTTGYKSGVATVSFDISKALFG